MSETLKKPLVLIIDDDPEFRNDILPAFVKKRLKGRPIEATDIQTGITQFIAHDASSDEPVDLAIVDMHMPWTKDTVRIHEHGGLIVLQALQFIRSYKINHCPIIIFTAHQTYEDCVQAIKHGADDYIPKFTTEGESNIALLEAACKKALERKAEAKQEVPSSQWLAANYAWLCEQHGGQWVVLVDEEQARAAGLDTTLENTVRSGLYIIHGKSYENVRKQLSSRPPLWHNASEIALLPTSQS